MKHLSKIFQKHGCIFYQTMVQTSVQEFQNSTKLTMLTEKQVSTWMTTLNAQKKTSKNWMNKA